MVQQLVKDMLVQQHPIEESDEVQLDSEDPCSFDQIQFFVKSSGSAASYDYRYHCSAPDDADKSACGRISLEDCTNVGSYLPDLSVLCKHCSRARPEAVEAYNRQQ